jgi:hypothetical protein
MSANQHYCINCPRVWRLGEVMLQFEQRMFVRLAFLSKMAECHGEEFQEFFQDLMCHRYSDFVDVRTAGRLGDQGADGFNAAPEATVCMLRSADF